MNLYRKIRPKTFDEVLGNDAEIESLKKLLKKGESQAFVFSGESGCGKTTLARIAANELGADNLSIKEINSANNRGIDTARELQQDLKYIIPDGSAKVFIIDEAHGTTPDWKRAMLKPLEDTPKGMYFFLCTTNSKKLFQGDEGKAIKTRCKEIKVSPLDPKLIYRLLRKTAKKEDMDIDPEVLEEISENCNGSPRQAIELLEKIADLDNKKTQLKAISSITEFEEDVRVLSRALLKKDKWGEIKNILKSLKDLDVENIRYTVLGYMNAVLLNKNDGQAAWVIECFLDPFYNSGKAGLTAACFRAINED